MSLPEELGNLYVNCGAYFVGLMATAVLTDFVKIVIGRLRPNFLAVCQPERDIYTDLCHNRTYLVPELDFKCMSHDTPSVIESRKSFPSGHASLSFYAMCFLVLFINFTWKCRRMGLLPRFVQFFLAMVAVYASITRFVDNKHHTSDILAGCVLGILMSLVTFFYLTDFRANLKYKVRSCESADDEETCRANSGCSLFEAMHPRLSKNKENEDEHTQIPLTTLANADSVNELDVVANTKAKFLKNAN